jgi:hypothetical protein
LEALRLAAVGHQIVSNNPITQGALTMTNIHDLQARQILDDGRGIDISAAVGGQIFDRVMDTGLLITQQETDIECEYGYSLDVMTLRAIHKLTAAVMELTHVIAIKS